MKLGMDHNWLKQWRLGKVSGPARQSMSPIAIMTDGSVDIACKDQYIVFARAIVNGRAETLFLGAKSSKASADAITEAVLSIVDEMLIDRRRIFFLATDGAAVMTGVHNGVAAQILRELPFLIHVHCITHR